MRSLLPLDRERDLERRFGFGVALVSPSVGISEFSGVVAVSMVMASVGGLGVAAMTGVATREPSDGVDAIGGDVLGSD